MKTTIVVCEIKKLLCNECIFLMHFWLDGSENWSPAGHGHTPLRFQFATMRSSTIAVMLSDGHKTKKQDKLLSTVTQDVAHDVGPDHLHNSMWDYLKKYKNNHTTSSLLPTTRSNASPDKQIWITGPLPSTPLTGTAFDSPWAITFSTTHSHPTIRKVHKTLLNSFPE